MHLFAIRGEVQMSLRAAGVKVFSKPLQHLGEGQESGKLSELHQVSWKKPTATGTFDITFS